MTEQEYEMNASAIAAAIWEISTGNGRDLDENYHDSHMQNCHAAVANSFTDDITIDAWQGAALARVAA